MVQDIVVAAAVAARLETTMTRFLFRGALASLALLLSLGALASPFPRLDQFGRSLDLSPAQQAQFDIAVGATQRAVFAMAANALHMKTQVTAEFAKVRPDLERLARLKDAGEAIIDPLRHAARAEWLRLYAMLSDEQVAKVKAHLQEHFDHLEALQQFVMRLMLGKPGAGS
jgi:hypothetical protein